MEKIKAGMFEGHSQAQVAAVLQGWLFFGLIRKVLDCDFDIGEFLFDRHGHTFVTTRNFTKFRDARRVRAETQLFADKHNWYNESYWSVQEATNTMDELAKRSAEGNKSPLQPEIELSIYVMISTLQFELASFLSAESLTRRIVDESGIRTCQMLQARMLEDGWCPSHVEMLASSVDAAAMYFAVLLGPPKVMKDHGKCSDHSCEAEQIIESEYVTKHATSSCSCDYLGPDSGQIASVLEAGGVPCISISPSATWEDISLEVTEVQAGQAYVAISHVWSGGLGNPVSNSLPRCQLIVIRDRVAAIQSRGCDEGHIRLWMDTLCVPLVPQTLRSQAIKVMKRTFAEAKSVLVLEAELMQATRNCGNEEKLMRIYCSSWLRRLWTYQEGMLAQTLIFQFSDGPVSLQELWAPMYYGTVYDARSNGIALQAATFYRSLRGFSGLNKPARFASLWQAPQWRKTSRVQDEAICVAALFDLNLDAILETPADARFKKLLELQSQFLLGTPFLAGERMSDHGYRWAPIALMSPRGNDVHMMVQAESLREYFGTWTPEGLLGNYEGFEILGSFPRPSSETFRFKCNTNEKWYVVSRAADKGSKWIDTGPHALLNPAIILQQPIEYLIDWYKCLGILVSIWKKDKGVYYARYSCRVIVKAELSDMFSVWNDVLNGNQGVENMGSKGLIECVAREGSKNRDQNGVPGRPWCIG